MRLALSVLAVSSAFAQVCPPERLSPAGTASGVLDNSSCFLSDATAYASYRLDLPARGRIHIALTTAEDFILLLRDGSGAKIDSGAAIQRPLEAGAYTLLVNARVPGQTGRYSVRSEFTPESGVLCKGFPSIGPAETVDAALGAAGCASPDGSPYDAYALHTLGAGTLTVSVAADWSPAIFLRTPDGAALAAGDGVLTAVVDRDTPYQVVVSGAQRGGAYQLTTAFTPAENETCRPTRMLSGGETHSGTISPESCTLTLPGSGDLVYYNYYAISVGSAGLADFTAASPEFTPALTLLDESGNTIGNDAAGGEAGGSQIRTQLRPGRYLVQVASSVPSGGPYRFAYALAPADPRPCATAALDLAAGNSGTLSAASCRTEIGVADLYTVTLPSSGTLDLTVSPFASLSAVVAVRDLKDNLVVLSRDVQDLGVARLSADLPAGSYTVLAGAGSGTGFYQLTGAVTAHEFPCPDPEPLALNTGWVKRLGPSSCRRVGGAPVDYYQFTLPSEAVTAMVMTSSDLDGHLTLLDSAGAALRSDDNSYGLGDPIVVQHLPAGTYRLAARPASGTVGGLYRVDVLTAFGPRPPFCGPKATIPIGNTVSGTIDFSGCQYTDDTFADIYRIEVTEPATVDIRLKSAEFDAYLLLLDAKGNLIDRDDDGDGDTDARIVPSLLPGTYYVVAKPVEYYTAGGAYTLSVQ